MTDRADHKNDVAQCSVSYTHNMIVACSGGRSKLPACSRASPSTRPYLWRIHRELEARVWRSSVVDQVASASMISALSVVLWS